VACGTETAFRLCRAFPIEAPPAYESGTVDDDNAGAAIVDGFGQLLLGIVKAALDADDDSDDKVERDRVEPDRAPASRGGHSDRRPARPSIRIERKDPGEARRSRQDESRSLKRR